MFWKIVIYEINHKLRKLSTHIYSAIFFLCGTLFVIAIGGTIPGLTVSLGTGSKTFVNSPYLNTMYILSIGIFSLFITAAIMSETACRDFEHKIHALIFTKPVKKSTLILGRFLGSIIVLLMINLFFALGLFVGSKTSFIDPIYFGPYRIMAYLYPYIIITFPNLLFTGALFLAIGLKTRKSFNVYLTAFILFVSYLIADSLISDLKYENLAAILDAMGGTALTLVTKNWTITEINKLFIPATGYLLYNRLLWIGISAILIIFLLRRFKFSFFLTEKAGKKIINKKAANTKEIIVRKIKLNRQFNFKAHFAQFLQLIKLQIRSILKSPPFYVISVLGLLLAFTIIFQSGKIYGTSTLPLTWTIVEAINHGISLLILVFITIYTADLIWRERSTRSELIFDSCPVPNWVYLLSKFASIQVVNLIFFGMLMIFGILFQLFSGFTDIDLMLYLKFLLGIEFVKFFVLTSLVFIIQIIVNNKYFGHFFVLGTYFFFLYAPRLGIEHYLLRFGKGINLVYSDMNHFGHYGIRFFWMTSYWVLISILFLVICNRIMVRGKEISLKNRIKRIVDFTSRGYRYCVISVLSLIAITSMFIFYNINILNEFHTTKYYTKESVSYEQIYKKYHRINQPRIREVSIKLDLFPQKRDLVCSGQYVLKNISIEPISELHVLLDSAFDDVQFSFKEDINLIENNEQFGYRIYHLKNALNPQDSLFMDFSFTYNTKGFSQNSGSSLVQYNGTFINSSILPHIGYREDWELGSNKERRKYDLPKKSRMASISDSSYYDHNYVSDDGDWIKYKAQISTSTDQTALTIGNLVNEWQENGRNYFQYEMPLRMINYFCFLSARYEVYEDSWNDVPVKIFYNKGHEFNLDRMASGAKRALEYYNSNFGAYPYDIVRIAEFPRYSTFAQSFPTLIPYSESVGFIANVKDNNINYPLFVTAHEMAHHYWAHQVIGADVQGSILFSEGLAQYSALQIMRQDFTAEQMREFLRRELDSYLRARSSDPESERPLCLEEGLGYLHYNKGSFVMYALADYLGTDTINSALAEFVKDYQFQGPPYPTSKDFLPYLDNCCPDSLSYLIDDMFRYITLYENRITEAQWEETNDGRYNVNLTVETEKLQSDDLGNEQPIAMHDLIEIGIFEQDEDGELHELFLKKLWLESGKNKFSFIVDHKPSKAGIDPYYKLVDRRPVDNVMNVEERSS